MEEIPARIEPMLATLSELPSGEDWSYEFKWDGVRAITFVFEHNVRIQSRNLIDISLQYPELSLLKNELNGLPIVLDGEIIALDEIGKPDFGRLQQRMHLSEARARIMVHSVPVRYFVFDILFWKGRSIVDRSYLARREILEGLNIQNVPLLKIPPRFYEDGQVVLETAKKHRLEGVVAKQNESRYEPGRRSNNWRKVKIFRSQELVVGGWIPRERDASRIGALAVGFYSNEQSKLIYAGCVGSGFSEAVHAFMVEQLRPLQGFANPFEGPVPREVIFVEPILVAEIAYRRWPSGGQIQQASFKGLRRDISARSVRRDSG